MPKPTMSEAGSSCDQNQDRAAQRARQALRTVYGQTPGFDLWVDRLIASAETVRPRNAALRPAAADWLSRRDHVGYSAYLDLFCGNLENLSARIGYLKSLGVTYLHLLPFYQAQSGESDGGFAVADYRSLAPGAGSIGDLRRLVRALEDADIKLCLDFVLNHAARDHPWAVAARNGDPAARARFCIETDSKKVQALDAVLPEVFPQTAPGNFTYEPEIGGWVRTTFYPFQWDLNYANRDVFEAMLGEFLFLAGLGVGALRLDSAPYVWKSGTGHGRNAPEAHALIEAFRAFADMAAPSLVLKAEAIVPSQEIIGYFGQSPDQPECHTAYHALLMAGLWTAIATEQAEPVATILNAMAPLPEGCRWMSYVRCHDDIGIGILQDEAAAPPGFIEHLREASAVLSGAKPGSPYRGVLFQSSDPARIHGICGTLGALVGLQSAASDTELDNALARYGLLHAAISASGGIPLIYSGDEIGAPNAPTTRKDARWVHRSAFDWSAADRQSLPGTLENRLHGILCHVFAMRQRSEELALSVTPDFLADGPILAIRRNGARGETILLLNLSSEPARVPEGSHLGAALSGASWQRLDRSEPLAGSLSAYGIAWLIREHAA